MAYNVYGDMTDTKILACRTNGTFDSLYEHKLTRWYTYSFAIEHIQHLFTSIAATSESTNDTKILLVYVDSQV